MPMKPVGLIRFSGEEGSGPVRQRGTKPASVKQEENNRIRQI